MKHSYKVRPIVEINGRHYVKAVVLRKGIPTEVHCLLPIQCGKHAIKKGVTALNLTTQEALSLAKKGFIVMAKAKWEEIQEKKARAKKEKTKPLIKVPGPMEVKGFYSDGEVSAESSPVTGVVTGAKVGDLSTPVLKNPVSGAATGAKVSGGGNNG